MLVIPDSNVHLPGRAIDTRPSSHDDGWRNGWLTVELYQDVEAMRVSVHRRGLMGDWFAIGDFVQTRQEYAATHSLPKPFLHQALCVLRPGTVVNVGVCSALFSHPGGSLQAEFLDGPLPRVRPIEATWVSYWGNA
jgi:hypothetical protein